MASVFTLQHCCRSGKTLLACAALVGPPGLSVPGEVVQLRAHQSRALDKMGRVPGLRHCTGGAKNPVVSAMVFSSGAVLRQFHGRYLADAPARVVCVCSKPPAGAEAAGSPAEILAAILAHRASGEPLVLLVLYHSARKLFDAVQGGAYGLVDVIAFDEAHNLHTPKRTPPMFWEDPDRLDRMFPVRVFLTATPREEMVSGEFVRLYGDPDDESRWDVFHYADALELQRQDAAAIEMVKPLRVKVLINGCTRERLDRESIAGDPEFFDVVAVVREIAEAREEVRRVKVYNRRAKEGVRSSEYLADGAIWREALAYLHKRGEALSIAGGDLDVRNVDGTMALEGADDDGDNTRLSETLAWFNEDVPHHGDGNNGGGGGVRVLLSCRVFGEGVTLNRVDLTVFADGKGSRRDIVQSGLRGARADPRHPGRPLDVLLLVNAANADGTPLSESGMGDARAAHACINSALKSRKNFKTIATVLHTLMEADPEVRRALEAAVARAARTVDRDGDGSGGADDLDDEDGETAVDEDMEDGGNGDIGRGFDSERAFSMRVQPELLPEAGFGWAAETLAESEAHILHSAAIETKLIENTEVKARFAELEAAFRKANPDWKGGQTVKVPPRGSECSRNFYQAVRENGFIAKNQGLVMDYPMVQQAYTQLLAKRDGKQTPLEKFSDLEEAFLKENPGWQKGQSVKIPGQKTPIGKKWNHVVILVVKKNKKLLLDYPILQQAYTQRMARAPVGSSSRVEEAAKIFDDLNPNWRPGEKIVLPCGNPEANLYREFEDGRCVHSWWYNTGPGKTCMVDPKVFESHPIMQEANEIRIEKQKLSRVDKANEFVSKFCKDLVAKGHPPRNDEKFSDGTFVWSWWNKIWCRGFIENDSEVRAVFKSCEPLWKYLEEAWKKRDEKRQLPSMSEEDKAIAIVEYAEELVSKGRPFRLPPQDHTFDDGTAMRSWLTRGIIIERNNHVLQRCEPLWKYLMEQKESRDKKREAAMSDEEKAKELVEQAKDMVAKGEPVRAPPRDKKFRDGTSMCVLWGNIFSRSKKPKYKQLLSILLAYQPIKDLSETTREGTHKEKVKQFNETLEEINQDWREGQNLKLPSMIKEHPLYRKFSDGTSMAGWWHTATSPGGFISKKSSELKKFPFTEIAFGQCRKKPNKPKDSNGEDAGPCDIEDSGDDDDDIDSSGAADDSGDHPGGAASPEVSEASPPASPPRQAQTQARKRARDPRAEAERGVAERLAWLKRRDGGDLSPEEEALADAHERGRPSARPDRPRCGYGESWEGGDHPAWKEAMNDLFGEALGAAGRGGVGPGEGLVLVLDDDAEPAGGFGTSRRLTEHHGVKPGQLRIVQMDETKARRMQKHPDLGARVVAAEVAAHLRATGERYTGAYLDMCGTWARQLRPALEALLGGNAVEASPEFVLGVTWCTRDASGATSDDSELELLRMLLGDAGMQCRRLRESSFGTMRTGFYKLTGSAPA